MNVKSYPCFSAMRHLDEVRGKFVQLEWNNEPWLLLASKDQHAFHNQIVAHFLTQHHLPHHWHSPEHLEFSAEGLHIIGGGKFHLNFPDSRLVLSDNSMVYGRFDEEKLASDLDGLPSPWSELMIEIL